MLSFVRLRSTRTPSISRSVRESSKSSISPAELTIELGMKQTEYELEQFPALMYCGSEYVILAFSSGKLLCTRLTDYETVSEAIENMASRVQAVM